MRSLRWITSIVVDSKEMGADDYLTKPFNPQDLVDKVKQYELAKRSTAS